MYGVDSTTTAAIGYDEDVREVYVEYRSGQTFAYSEVPPSVWEDFEAAPSKGAFINQVLKPGYAAREVA